MWFMAVLLPDMSSMFMTVQTPVVSASHAMWHVDPSLYTEPGPGSEGLGSAWTATAARRVAKKIEESIVLRMELGFVYDGGIDNGLPSASARAKTYNRCTTYEFSEAQAFRTAKE